MADWKYPVEPKFTPKGGTFGSTIMDDGSPRKVPHSGHDYARNSGETIYSCGPGTVKYIGYNPLGWGHYVWIYHGNNIYSGYAHLAKATGLKVGAKVSSKTVIGKVGATGAVSGAHLHWVIGIGSWSNVFNLVRTFLKNPVTFIKSKIGSTTVVAINQRQIIATKTARQRTKPSVLAPYNPNDNIDANKVITPKGFVESKLDGGTVSGSNIWLELNSGTFVHISGTTNKTTVGLTNLTVPELEVPVDEEEPVIIPETPGEETPTPEPIEPDTDTDPIVDFDLDELDDALETAAEQIGPLLPEPTRKKIYQVMSNAGLVLAAIGASALSTAGVVGGEIGAKIATGSAIATTVGLALSAGANKLAQVNTQPKPEPEN